MSQTNAKRLAEHLDSLFARETGNWHVPATLALDGLDARRAAWRPEGLSHSVWDLVNHLRYENQSVLHRWTGAPAPTPAPDPTETPNWPPAGDPDDAAAWQEAQERLWAAHRGLVAYLRGVDDADLDSPPPGGSRPRRKTVEGIIGHNSYHLGQIVFLRRLQDSWQIWQGY